MKADPIVIVETGVANYASIVAALSRLGRESHLSSDPKQIAQASHLVLPGVGTFASAMQSLREANLTQTLQDRIRQGRPTLAICLGLHLLSSASEESPGETGLAIWPQTAIRIANSDSANTQSEKAPTTSRQAVQSSTAQTTTTVRRLRVPQIGWNRIIADSPGVVESGYAYFANSYRLTECPVGWTATWSKYGAPLVASVQRGAVVACQFHPELSDDWGMNLIRRWLRQSPTGG